MSWIHIDDALRAIAWCMSNRHVRGPVNLTAPFAVTNDAFTRALAHALGRPAAMHLPAPFLRAVLGSELASELLLGGSKVPSLPCGRPRGNVATRPGR